MALTGAVVVLSRDSLISAVAPAPAPFDIPATTALVQAKVQPGVALVAVYANGVTSQTDFEFALFIVATGLRVVVVERDGEGQFGTVVY